MKKPTTSMRSLFDPAGLSWRTEAAIAALERRRDLRVIAVIVMGHAAILAGLVAAIAGPHCAAVLATAAGSAAFATGWNLACICRANTRITRLRKELRR